MTTTIEKAYAARDYWEKRLTEKWGLHGVGHISYGLPYNPWLYRVRQRVFLRHITPLPIKFEESTVLDIGSGTGFWLNVWRSLGVRDLVGSDMTSIAVENLRKGYPSLKIFKLDISDREAVGNMEGRFHLISAFDVLYHVMEEDRFQNAISNVSTLLSPGGYFLFTDSFLRSSPTGSAHQVNRTLDEYICLLRTNGLEVIQRAPMFVLMQTPSDMTSPIPAFIWRLSMVPVKLVPSVGHIYGAALFPLEMLFTKYLKESPSTEIMICRKSGF